MLRLLEKFGVCGYLSFAFSGFVLGLRVVVLVLWLVLLLVVVVGVVCVLCLVGVGGVGVLVCCCCFSIVAMSRAIAHLWCQRQQFGSWSSLSGRSQICLISLSCFVRVVLLVFVVMVRFVRWC